MLKRISKALVLVSGTMGMLTGLAWAQGDSAGIPRLANGKPDFGGVWDHPRTGDLTRATNQCAADSKGCNHEPAPPLSYTPAGLAKWNDKESHFDWTARCLPWGYTRVWGAEYPVEFIQTPQRLGILFESNNTYKIIPTDGSPMPQDSEPSWWGVSRGRWEGDTLLVDTKGFNAKTYLDTAEHPHGEKLQVIERFQMTDRNHITREVTIIDPEFYTEPFKYKGVLVRMKPGSELMEYVCMENNRWLEHEMSKGPVKLHE